jgi:hypothetical protein
MDTRKREDWQRTVQETEQHSARRRFSATSPAWST